MKKILMMGVREDEKYFARKWAEEHNVIVHFSNQILDEKTYELTQGFDGLCLQQTVGISKELYHKLAADGFKQIAQRSAGIDMYDLQEAKNNNLMITNVPAYSPNAIAEFTVATLLYGLRHLQLIKTKNMKFDFTWNQDILSKEVRSLNIGILGTGRIGQVVAKILNGFGAHIIGYDLYQNENAKDYLQYEEDFNTFLAQSDVITIHMPLTKGNYHLFDENTFSKMKNGAILINAARGGIIDTQALLNALNTNKLSFCALDTYENEMPYVNKDCSNKEVTDDLLKQLIANEKVLYTPHIAFYTETAVENLVYGGLNACLDILNTGTSEYVVNP
ncbi:D-2-hydroxyacid dehydrogenase [Enterococcus cecorum]|uniref:D-2-hydroxyacid dehydrogenase n=1 Tax=Enterococcus cecorum TaxID=44008 RepID=UPI002ACAA706|nr:D-2-hydroxyacid dehydrogenase [Enterococcus cecorum]MDZ5584718.1 D-2-hydroxyacid dehydrogenase [Enterococcus cecorum]